MNRQYQTYFATAFCVVIIHLWIPAVGAGSGWILFVAFLATVGLVSNRLIADKETIAATILASAAAASWWFHRGFPDAKWMLLLCILCVFGVAKTFEETKKEDGKN